MKPIGRKMGIVMIEECVHCGWNAMGQCGCPGAVKEQIRIDELDQLRAQLAAEIAKREMAEGELSRFKKGNPQELYNFVKCVLCKSGADFVYTIKCAGDEIIYICAECAGKTVIRAIENFPELQQRATTAEQALQKSEAEKVELRCCGNCGRMWREQFADFDKIGCEKGGITKHFWPIGKECPYWAKAKAIIERGK